MTPPEIASQIGDFEDARDIYSLADLVYMTREQGSDADQLQIQSSLASKNIKPAICVTP